MRAWGGRLRKNSWGRYYVSDECDGCGACASHAACNFARTDDGRYYYVVQQPWDPAEERAVREAMRCCPLGCIRDNGEAA